MKNVPNILSISRIFFAISLLVLYSKDSKPYYVASVVIILVCVITDILDGMLARAYGVTSKLGYILDGLGDRSIHIGLYLVFFLEHRVGLMLIWLMIFREVALYALRTLITDWVTLKHMRIWSLSSGLFIKLWLGANIIIDGTNLFSNYDFFTPPYSFYITSLFVIACVISYIALAKYLVIILKNGNT